MKSLSFTAELLLTHAPPFVYGRAKTITAQETRLVAPEGLPKTITSDELRLMLPALGSLLKQAAEHGRARVGWEDLRDLCYRALKSAKPNAMVAQEKTSILSATLLYHYVRQGRPWTIDQRRRERIYNVAELDAVILSLRS